MAFVHSCWYVVHCDVQLRAKSVKRSPIFSLQGNTSGSAVVSELIYGFSNSMVLLNDCIIQTSRAGADSTINQPKFKLKFTLTILENMEVFIEMSARKIWGERGRWLFISIVQMMKCICRFLLAFKYVENVLTHPPIPTLDRKKVQETLPRSADGCEPGTVTSAFELKRSVRSVRKVEGSPPIHLRSWKGLDEKANSANDISTQSTKRDKLLVPEVIHILKPVIHLFSCSIYGQDSWESYCVALCADLISLRLHKRSYGLLTPDEKLEVSRRYASTLMYLIRTPFYEKYTETKIMHTLKAVGSFIPYSELIQQQCIQFIQHWREAYFYMW